MQNETLRDRFSFMLNERECKNIIIGILGLELFTSKLQRDRESVVGGDVVEDTEMVKR